MKYYRVKNDIIKEFKDKDDLVIGRKTDEPQWAKDLDDSKKWHRITTSQDALYTYFCCDDKLEVKEAEKTDLKEIESVFKEHFPDRQKEGTLEIIKHEEQINVEKEIELKSKRINYIKCGTNWTGSVNGGTMIDGDVITGSLTNNDGYTLTINAGATITISGYYSLTNNGKATYVGTATNRITIKSGVASPLYASANTVNFNNIDAGSVCSYCNFRNLEYGIRFTGTTSSTNLTFSYNYITNCFYGALVPNMSNSVSMTVSNCKIEECYVGIMYNNNTDTLILSNCEIKHCFYMMWGATENSPNFLLTLTNCKFEDCGGTVETCSQTISGCLYTYCGQSNVSANTNHSITNSIAVKNISRRWYAGGVYATTEGLISGCDFIGANGNNVILISGAGTTVGGWRVDDCYVAGGKTYDNNVYDSGNGGTDDGTYNTNSTLGMITNAELISNIRTTRKWSFTPASITESSLGDNGVTIDWTVGFKTRHRIKYGTVSGSYTMVAQPYYDWSAWDGVATIMTTTPSIALVNLKSGTLYYYVVESWDWALQIWVASAEGDFTTTSSGSSVTSVTIDDTSITTMENVTVTILASSSPTIVGVKINSKIFIASGSGGTYTAVINGAHIGTGTTMTVTGFATNASGGDETDSASTLTVTQATDQHGMTYSDYIPINNRGKSWWFQLKNCGTIREIQFFGEQQSDK